MASGGPASATITMCVESQLRGVSMKTTTIAKMVLGLAAPLLVLTVAPAMAFASTDNRGTGDQAVDVPCSGSEGGAAGLIAAINNANAGGGGTINLARRCTYVLSVPNNAKPMLGANGLPLVTSRITIKGGSDNGGSDGDTGASVDASESAGTTIAGNGTGFRIFEVDGPGGNLTLRGLTITRGFSSFGGGILNNDGVVTLNHSQVTGNMAGQAGGGIASGDPTHLGSIATLTLNFSQVNANTALSLGGFGGGGGILSMAGALTLNHSQVNDNTSAGGGGGIASGSGGGAGSSTLILKFSQVNNNTSTGGPRAGAGGIANGGMATISESQVNNNKAPGAAGGGILNHGTMTINHSEVNGNQAANDGLGNDGIGGGIANLLFGIGGVLTINSSQVNGNSASGIGGGILEAGFNLDGTFAAGGLLALNHSQVTENTSVSGGGIWATAGSPVTLKHTSIRENTPDNCFPPGSIPGCSG